MLALGIEERMIFVDKQSGKDFNLPSYQTMKRILRKGDLLYLDALDRLGRDYEGIIHEWKHITRNIQADIVVLENETLFDSRKYREMEDIGKLKLTRVFHPGKMSIFKSKNGVHIPDGHYLILGTQNLLITHSTIH